MDGVRRKEVIAELASAGYATSYIDSWPPKVTMYRHKPGLNMDGVVCFPVGTMLPNQPGNPDHAARKSKLGLLPWPPSDVCKCKACRERVAAAAVAKPVAAPEPVVAETLPASVPKAKPPLTAKQKASDARRHREARMKAKVPA